MDNPTRLESDGTACGTHLYLADGHEIKSWSRITWSVTQGEDIATAYVEFPLTSCGTVESKEVKGSIAARLERIRSEQGVEV